tara:strand:- start:66 stop:725 length:660 start_codon:yes stop_codon:yes gene_type:complete
MLVRWTALIEFLSDSEIEECSREGMSDEALDEPDWFFADFCLGGRLSPDCYPTHYMPLPAPPAARSESEDTQPKATPSQADVGVQHVQKLHELDDEATSLQNVQRTYWANKGPTPLIETTFATHGHGYVVPRTDGMKVRCGGPAACERCAADKELLETARALRANTQSRPTQADVDALVKAMEALTEAYGAIHVSHGLDPEESPRYVAARAALTPFQKG